MWRSVWHGSCPRALRIPETSTSLRTYGLLVSSVVSDVHLVARRRPKHAEFSPKELHELSELASVTSLIGARQVLTFDQAPV